MSKVETGAMAIRFETRGTYPESRIGDLEQGIGNAVDDLAEVVEWLRAGGQFQQADRLRTITGRLARLAEPTEILGRPSLIRDIARGWK